MSRAPKRDNIVFHGAIVPNQQLPFAQKPDFPYTTREYIMNKNKVILLSVSLVIIFLFIFTAQLLVSISLRQRSLETKISTLSNTIDNYPLIYSEQNKGISLSDQDRTIQTLLSASVQEQLTYLKDYSKWATYNSDIGIKFRYPARFGCNGSSWEIKKTDDRVEILTCDRYTGTFEQTPRFTIQTISGKSYLELGKQKNPPNTVWSEAFGLLYTTETGRYIRLLPIEIHKPDFTYFQVVLSDPRYIPLVAQKLINSVQLSTDTRNVEDLPLLLNRSR